jgi:cell division septum initiation protein DivIVA
MTDKEFKRLTRAQLIDIIYQLQLEIDKLNEQKQALEKELADKRLRLSNAGNIAEAALEINDCFRSAQNAAEQYLNEIKAIREETEAQRQRILSETQEQRERVLSETQEERQRIIAEAQAEAEVIIAGSKKARDDYDAAIETILQEYGQSHWNNG